MSEHTHDAIEHVILHLEREIESGMLCSDWLMQQANLARTQLIDLVHTHSWIPVTERMPLNNVIVLGCRAGGRIRTALTIGGRWLWDEFDTMEDEPPIVAWMPLPSPYGEIYDTRQF